MTTATARTPIAAEGAPAPSRRSALLAGLVTLWFAVAAAGIALGALNSASGSDLLDDALYMAISVVFAAIGTVVAAKTGHPIGWLLIAVAVSFPLGGAAEQYALYGLVTAPGSVPAPTAVASAVPWPFGVATTSLALTLLLFPTGIPRSRRWRPVLIATPIANSIWVASIALRPAPLSGPWIDHRVVVRNPIGVEPLGSLLEITFGIGVAAALAFAFAAVASLVLRFRSSRGVERQQIKWLAYVAMTAAAFFATNIIVGPLTRISLALSDVLWIAFFMTLMLGLPLSIGAAILRYRLYDIDRIISRTVSYAIVTALFAGLYALVAVIVPAALLGSGDTPDGVIAGATLLVAAAFVPVRRRVQNAVDRRFNRARYDAARTIEAFTARLRDEIDIDALGAELESVVGSTMQPSHVDLWLAKR